jgi:hypothetical protein
MKNKICNCCGEVIILDKWCSYGCLVKKADEMGVSPEDLLIEMERDALDVKNKAEAKAQKFFDHESELED